MPVEKYRVILFIAIKPICLKNLRFSYFHAARSYRSLAVLKPHDVRVLHHGTMHILMPAVMYLPLYRASKMLSIMGTSIPTSSKNSNLIAMLLFFQQLPRELHTMLISQGSSTHFGLTATEIVHLN